MTGVRGDCRMCGMEGHCSGNLDLLPLLGERAGVRAYPPANPAVFKTRCFFQQLAQVTKSGACKVANDRYNPQRFPHTLRAEVAKSVDAVDSKSTVEIRAGSSPAFGTNSM